MLVGVVLFFLVHGFVVQLVSPIELVGFGFPPLELMGSLQPPSELVGSIFHSWKLGTLLWLLGIWWLYFTFENI